MPSRSETRATVPHDRVGDILEPRTGLVRERLVERTGTVASFEAATGPVRAYRRTVSLEPRPDGAVDVVQVVEHSLAIPIFGWLFHLPYRRGLARLGAPHRAYWWAPPDAVDTRAAAVL
ncbi:MAG TPA: hypothetical protein VFV35_00800, partial [Acidimicrobiales bacterium]|nr:hypothetical protein [Acidimicrobiales bacterium]